MVERATGVDMSQVSDFLNSWQYQDQPMVIFEAGAHYCEDTLELHRLVPLAQIWAFEPNPETLPKCREAVKDIPQIHLIETAVGDDAGIVPFFQIDTRNTVTTHGDGNPGASSLFMATGKYPTEKYVQKIISVEMVTFGDVIRDNNLPGVDILWLDMQGGELAALHGLGDYIHTVKLIMIEVQFKPIYYGVPLYPEIKRFMETHGFEFVRWDYISEWFANAIYRRKNG